MVQSSHLITDYVIVLYCTALYGTVMYSMPFLWQATSAAFNAQASPPEVSPQALGASTRMAASDCLSCSLLVTCGRSTRQKHKWPKLLITLSSAEKSHC